MDELNRLAEVVAISVDPPSESRKLDQLLNGVFHMLSDPELKVIRAYQMEHQMGRETVGNMGYVVIDGKGLVRKIAVDPLFGRHADVILQSLREIQ